MNKLVFILFIIRLYAQINEIWRLSTDCNKKAGFSREKISEINSKSRVMEIP